TADRNRSHWSTSKTPSYTKSVSWQHHLSQQSATGKKNDCLVLFDSGKRRFKRKQNIFLRR
ncbi:hypothetical protein, partial [Escherichia coli]|uniref:hypothetical protein n=1 Tax=Escherichia coli TaxID=562 RepID=UPI001BC843A9